MASLAHLLHSLSRPLIGQPAAIQNEINAINQLISSGDSPSSSFSSSNNGQLADMGDRGAGAKLAHGLTVNRFGCLSWIASNPARRWISSLLKLARMLFKEKNCVEQFHTEHVHSSFVQFCAHIAKCLSNHESEYSSCTTLMLNVTQKLTSSEENAELFVQARLHKTLLKFLASTDMAILQGTLEVLGRLSDWSSSCRVDLCASTAVDVCLQLVPNGDILTQKLCVSLLRILSCEEQARQQISIYDGVPILVGLLSMRNSRLQWHVAWCLAQLADDMEICSEISHLGAMQLVVAELSAATPPPRAVNDWLAMLTGLCALLAQLCQLDSSQLLLVNNNGIYLLGRLLLLAHLYPSVAESPTNHTLQCSVFRVLRLLFSLERNRYLFKKVFTASIFEEFIDIGHYVQDLTAYQPIVQQYQKYMASLDPSAVASLWDGANQKKEPLGRVAEFELLEQLGAGAFGCVYTARKPLRDAQTTQQIYALKEIFMVQVKESDPDKSFGDIISEVKIIKQQLRHPNIVRYRRIFVENNRLYIVMDLIEGASLKEHITSIKEKRERFAEDRIWNMLIQMVLALRYLHKDKNIVHRDLKPNNIMITDTDRVVITDFGLAKQKGPDYLKSAAGTIIYCCPEIVQNMPYGEKADIWSLGCCIYEMMALKPAFYSQNMLQLATLIVEGRYEPPPKGYSSELRDVVSQCLSVTAQSRPDIMGVATAIAPRLLACLDDVIRINASTRSSSAGRERDGSANRKSSSLTSSATSSSGALVGLRKKNERERQAERVPDKQTVQLPQLASSIDKPRRTSAKSLSAGQISRRGSMASSCSLPRIAARNEQRRVTVVASDIPKRGSSSADGRVRSEGLTLRSGALRPVADPMLRILEQIHTVLLVSFEPTSDSVNHKRRLVEQFRRRVFSKQSSAEEIKKHFRKLAAESTDDIDLELGYTDFRPALEGIFLNGYEQDQKITRVTYEQLAACVHMLLKS